MAWNPQLESILKDWAIRISRRSTQHVMSARQYDFYGSMLMYGAITLGFGSGFVDFIAGSQGEEFVMVTRYVSGGLSMFAGIMTTIAKFSNFLELREKHKVAANEYSALFHYIQLQLATEVDGREPAKQFFASTTKKFQDIQKASPLISSSIECKEKDLFERKKKVPPEVLTSTRETPGKIPKQDSAIDIPSSSHSDPHDTKKKRRSFEIWKRPLPNTRAPPSYIHDDPTGVPMFSSSDPDADFTSASSNDYEMDERGV